MNNMKQLDFQGATSEDVNISVYSNGLINFDLVLMCAFRLSPVLRIVLAAERYG
jgi:hypothetical protein